MENEKFTPGPWSLLFNDKTKVVFENKGVAIFVADTYGGFTKSDSEQEANAALISAAPELYKELEKHCALCMLRHPECEGCKLCETRKVLKKARGENENFSCRC